MFWDASKEGKMEDRCPTRKKIQRNDIRILNDTREAKSQILILVPSNKMHNISLTSDCQRSSGSVVSHCESDCSRVSFSDASEREAVHPTLGLDQVHLIILQWYILEFPLGQGCLLMRNQAFEVDIFTLIYNAALQEFQYVNLNLCLTNTFQ